MATDATDDPSIVAHLTRSWAAAADRVCLDLPGGEPWTHAQVAARTVATASALAAAGVGPGDRVVVQVPKRREAVALYLATVAMGAVFVPVNPGAAPAELAFMVEDSEPSLLVVGDLADRPATLAAVPTLTLGTDGTGTLADAANDARCAGTAVSGASGSAGPGAAGSGVTAASSSTASAASGADAIAALADLVAAAGRGPDDLAAMLYTSGTTGRPKGAMLTHRGLVANARALVDAWGFTADDVLVHALPIFHVHGLFVALHCALATTAHVRFLPRFDVDAVVDALPASTVFMGVPTHYVRLLDDPRLNADTCASMRLFTSGSAPMTTATHQRFTARTGHRIVERYGMTEAGIITTNPLDGDRVPGTVGFALDDVELRVRADGSACKPGETGVVEISGPHLFAGYWNLPDRTAEAHTDDGWFVTGDVGSLDDEGRLSLEGRSGDMIITGGENVYPKEIEQHLDTMASVVESAVVGLPHPDFGEAVTAFVVADGAFDPADALVLLDRSLARMKHPKAFIVVDALPRNTMGKVQKHQLRTDHATHYDR
ncbi:MAG: AMP-binding protein [Acidimicrobiales bacterium]